MSEPTNSADKLRTQIAAVREQNPTRPSMVDKMRTASTYADKTNIDNSDVDKKIETDLNSRMQYMGGKRRRKRTKKCRKPARKTRHRKRTR